jgi:serine/threonine protein kinase
MSARKLSIDAMAHTATIPTSSQVELLPRTGRTIDNRYRITGLIGRGGMADVYQGDDMLLERPVAIKVLHRHLASDSTGLERFRREGMTLASIASANVVAIAKSLDLSTARVAKLLEYGLARMRSAFDDDR